jgi:DNA-binding LacI/PurR family transcriptional regulator
VSRRPTIADVAARAGVSKALVSLALRDAPGPNALTRERVLAAAEELGYRANRTASLLALRRTRQLGIVASVRSAFQAELVEDIQAAADGRGYEIVLSPLTRTHGEARAIESLVALRCEALILVGPESSEAALAAIASQLPVVAVGRRVRSGAVDVIRGDDGLGVAQAVDHLVELGHRSIVHIDGGRGTISADRRRGYRAAMTRHGLESVVIAGDLTESAGAAAVAALLGAAAPRSARPRDAPAGPLAVPTAIVSVNDRCAIGDSPAGPLALPTAIVSVNDRCAIGALDALLRAGVAVPEQISVTGYDDSALARLAHTDLTSVSQDAAEQARLAVEAAVERLDEGRVERREVVLPPRLVTRGTTAEAPFRERSQKTR